MPISALVWLPVGAAKRSARSVTTDSMFWREVEERRDSMALMESPREPIRSVMEVMEVLWRAKSSWVNAASREESSTGVGAGVAVMRVGTKTAATDRSLKKCILEDEIQTLGEMCINFWR